MLTLKYVGKCRKILLECKTNSMRPGASTKIKQSHIIILNRNKIYNILKLILLDFQTWKKSLNNHNLL